MLTNINVDLDEFSIFQRFLLSLFAFVFYFTYWFIKKFTILFFHCPQKAEASLGGQCLYKTK